VQKFGTKRAYQAFLGTHPNGLYADLARAEIERLDAAEKAPTPTPASNTQQMAALPPEQQPSNPAPTREMVEWDKIKDSSDPTVLQKFINRFPNAPLALTAKQRLDLIQQQQRAAAEEAKRKADEAAAQKKREEDERRAREAEAAEKAKAAAAEAAAQKEAEAARKAQEAKDKAEQAERQKAAAEAAVAQAAADKQAKEAEAARQRAVAAAAKEATCKDEQGRLEAILAKGSDGTGVDDLKNFSRAVTCDRLGPLVVVAIDRFSAEAAKRAATQPNAPELVRSAQTELARLGCFAGTIDGKLSTPTTGALSHYLSIEGQPTDNPVVTQALVTELTKHATRVCPVECKSGETLKGDTCIADVKPQASPSPAPATVSKSDDDNAPSRKKKQANRDRDEEQPRRKAASAPAQETPHVRQQALARPSIVSGGGGGGGGGGGSHTMIGVGF
jgi:hypothetical protein